MTIGSSFGRAFASGPVAPRVPDILLTTRGPATPDVIEKIARRARAGRSDSVTVEPSFPFARQILDEWHERASRRLERRVPHLGIFVRVRLGTDSEATVAELAGTLAEDLPEIESVVLSRAPTEEDLAMRHAEYADVVCITPDRLPRSPQRYLAESREGGLGVEHGWHRLERTRSWGVKVCVCEWGFDPLHSDLPPVELLPLRGDCLHHYAYHGTATLGVIGARRDGTGISGIAHGAKLLFSSEAGGYRTQCIGDAMLHLGEGDVLVLEMQAYVPRARYPQGAKVEVPAEYDPDVHAASLTAAGLGITVCAAAGNGAMDLGLVTRDGRRVWEPDDPDTDSLAIIVGAGDRLERAKTNDTNFGCRVDCQAWGDGIFAPRDGDSGSGVHDCFYDQFNATSAATAMIAGLVVCLQAVVKAADGRPLLPEEVRSRLAAPGNGLRQSPLDVASGRIGPLPDLAALILGLG